MSQVRRRSVSSENWGKPDRNEAGEPICRWCRCVVRPPRRTFCGEPCVHEWRIRSSPAYVREQVFLRDGGRCRACGRDVGLEERRWKRQRPPARDRAERQRWKARRPRWEADHVIPVADGGGECGLENYRLLCRSCHLGITLAWRRERRLRRAG